MRCFGNGWRAIQVRKLKALLEQLDDDMYLTTDEAQRNLGILMHEGEGDQERYISQGYIHMPSEVIVWDRHHPQTWVELPEDKIIEDRMMQRVRVMHELGLWGGPREELGIDPKEPCLE
jgi:hypothetical protein